MAKTMNTWERWQKREKARMQLEPKQKKVKKMDFPQYVELSWGINTSSPNPNSEVYKTAREDGCAPF